ncbi:beta-glucosidase [Marchantia polymorpha subsp. ruderalis]|uniref:Beta-glucosidase n=2 Tax=Marchantia polymorpha TaxID=3197 RepID=A0AAF6BF66_MARPO|nr:hypothetical protein MARPO_0027s0094 [Marchantia polymorpha]BBN10650.1 hypothetical protein Mp_5g05310 [Marchantia polymorpha subsp. ruderalis]|eukprot:PTQ42983.1 hypothetical protein MARPO_0027s0094 [Marchantia polymorpha]
MGGHIPPFLKKGFYVLLIVPLFALVFSHSQSWVMESEKMACIDPDGKDATGFHRSDFPKDFVFGTATSAYQIEGAIEEGGRGLTIWDTFTQTPGKIAGNTSGDIAVDSYHRYKDDIELLKDLNVDAYRFSIAWSRIIPDGIGQTVNMEGIAHYNRVIDALLSKGIKPYVTLYHWDLPQPLQDKLGGWTSPEIVSHFTYYAQICFASFGDRVKNWITFNEPTQFCFNGYGNGVHAPGRTSDRTLSAVGDSATEPYLAAHNVLLSHAATVELYRSNYQEKQGGTIGFTIDCEWAEPLSDSQEDKKAQERRLAFQLGWWLDPIFFGDYPAQMRENIGDRLPTFTEAQKLLLRDSLDFIGLNHYTSRWVTSNPLPEDPSQSNYWVDQGIQTTIEKDGVQIGQRAQSFWLYVVPWGLQKLIEHVWEKYKAPIYICENGMDGPNNETIPLEQYLNDTERVDFYNDYLRSVQGAIQNGADVRTYFAWSLMDNFEWAVGFTSRFGLYHVDFETLKRTPKNSAKWFSKFLQPRDTTPCQLG